MNIALIPLDGGEMLPTNGLTFAVAGERTATEFFPVHRLDWRTGNNKTWNSKGKVVADYAGWCIQQPDGDAMTLEDYELDDAMTALLDMNVEARGELVQAVEEITVQHKVEGGGTHDVKYWSLAKATLFLPIRGIPARGEDRWGIAYAWRVNAKGGKESVMRFHVFVKELMDVGYNRPLLVSMKGHATDKMRNALKVHNRTLNLVDALRMEQWRQSDDATPETRPEPLPYYAYGVPIVPSLRTMTVGKKTETTDTSEIYYPVADVPRELLRDAVVAQRFLHDTTITYDQALYVEEGDRVGETEKWSVAESQRIELGKDASDEAIAGTPDDSSYEPVDMDGKSIKAPF